MSRLFYGTGEFEIAQFGGRKALEVIEMVLTAFDCVVPDGAGVYCSSDVTTGRRLYFEVYPRHGARSTEELKDRLGPEEYKRVKGELIKSNIARCGEFTELLRRRGLVNLINPGPFVGLGFDQQHYHYLWELVIVRKAHQSYFNEGWEYSNGCTLEYAISHRKGIPVFDHLGRPLPLSDARALVGHAVADLEAHGIRPPMLIRNLGLLEGLS
jgi:hypothetical protein